MTYHGFAYATLVAFAAVGVGLLCGCVNVRLLIDAGRRLEVSGNPKRFVLSSLLRVCFFAIVAGVFAATTPGWALLLYLCALFTPIALRAFRASVNARE